MISACPDIQRLMISTFQQLNLRIPKWISVLNTSILWFDFCGLCLVFLMLWCLFIAALWSPEGKGLASWLLFIVILLLSHLVSWDRCGT